MIDSHCHLNFKNIKDNFSKILNNAKSNHVTCILSINTDPDDFLDHYNLIKDCNSIYLTYGLHPENVNKHKKISKDLIIKNTLYDKVIGIGETGLDFYHSKEFITEQYKSFESHIEASIETNIPIIIHQRNSENEIIDILKNYQKHDNLKVVFHCFTGSVKLKKFCLENDYIISLSGIITFKNANNLRDIVKDVPISSILLETDSPFLAPEPMRGKSNEPSYVKYTADFLTNFYDININQLTEITDNNFYNLFSKAIRYNEITS